GPALVIASSAVSAAIRPARCPPIPSATATRPSWGKRVTVKASWFSGRGPCPLAPATSNTSPYARIGPGDSTVIAPALLPLRRAPLRGAPVRGQADPRRRGGG